MACLAHNDYPQVTKILTQVMFLYFFRHDFNNVSECRISNRHLEFCLKLTKGCTRKNVNDLTIDIRYIDLTQNSHKFTHYLHDPL